MRSFLLISVCVALVCVLPGGAIAQEFEATVSINTQQLSSESRTAITGLDRAIEQYVNGYQWTGAEWKNAKIKISFSIAITSASGDGSYAAQLSVVSQRAVFTESGEPRLTPMLRVLDQMWSFTYTRGQPMFHEASIFDPIAGLIEFYSYLVLGLDFDSYDALSGTAYLRRASDVCARGASSNSSAGWTPTTGATYSRPSFIADLLDPRMEAVRLASWRYHYSGLDFLASKPDQARQAIAGVIDTLLVFKSNLNQACVVLDRFLDAKYLELCELYSEVADKSIYDHLESLDPSHRTYYEKYRNQ